MNSCVQEVIYTSLVQVIGQFVHDLCGEAPVWLLTAELGKASAY